MATINAVNTSLSGQSGTGSFAGTTSPTFVTPTLGAALATSINFGGSTLSSYISQGTFTPVLSFGGGSTGITYSTQNGFYTKNGTIVTFTMTITLSNVGSSTGQAVISGMPFSGYGSIFSFYTYNSEITYSGQITVFSSGTQLIPGQNVSGSSNNQLTNTAFSNSSRLTISGSYVSST